MRPPRLQIQNELSRRDLKLRSVTLGEPFSHGVVVEGTHGCGVRTPDAADVAEATAGLLRELHMPNDGMLVMD